MHATAAALISIAALAQQPVVPPAQMVDVAGHPVRIVALGLEQRKPGVPIVVFEAGATNSLDVWGGIPAQIAAVAPVVAYDRAGLGQSAWDNQRPTPQHIGSRLRELLKQIGAPPPYVLVGYSWGGTLARYFAGDYPSEVVGLVLVDPSPIVTQSHAERLAPYDAVGAGQAGYDAHWNAFAGFFENASPAIRAEFDVYRGLMERDPADRGLRPLPNVPLTVLVAAKYLDIPGLKLPFDPKAHFESDARHRIKMLQEWVLASPNGTMVVSNRTTHAIPREDPDLIVWAVKRVIASTGFK